MFRRKRLIENGHAKVRETELSETIITDMADYDEEVSGLLQGVQEESLSLKRDVNQLGKPA